MSAPRSVPYPELVLRTTQEALRRGLIVIRAGLHANCLRLLPPLDVDDAAVDEAMDVFAAAVAAALAPAASAEGAA
jgi:4-aminobutyrate aminotransferase-like enzyme